MNKHPGRRAAMQAAGMSLAVGGFGLLGVAAHASTAPGTLTPGGASALSELVARLAKAPRRRTFKTVPMILNNPDQWDHEALSEVLAYKPVTKQAWDNTEIGGAWLSGMRNSLNAQIWSFKHPDFLVVSETHGTAQLALYGQAMWDKYQLNKLAGPGFERNTLILEQPGASAAASDYENPSGVYSMENNSILALQRRGVVFMACHNAIWEQATKLHNIGQNPDRATVEVIAAELTNHLVPGVVLTPGAVATLPELQQAGFHYLRS
jgi:intracellular sulfur oxidation DsrE/DsrF family protein